ncbi:hypothetical protein D4764_14G0005660 [Takifugu flavidus]|uniref:Uncharacterized protein n=1 Tax=Takifugu flavidus TaxID=433684 RepID=A0A5C6P4M7_9TELE|nr:hypothetical protein D4764_14G0005660 [Takifugu flavidus]
MTPARLHTCCSLAWLAAVLSIGVLFAFHVHVQLCGNIIQQVYISNRGILDLACSPTHINNIYVHPAVNPGIYGLYKVLRGLAPSYLEELVIPYQPNRPLRSQNAGLLVVPRVSRSRMGGRTFSYQVPLLWNQLPVQFQLLS